MKKSAVLALALGTSLFAALGTAAAKEAGGLAPDAGLARLARGNARAAAGKAMRPHQNRARRKELASGQQPFAVVVSCSDSRVPPEIVFDQGLGDLFVVRVAGNVVDDTALGSIEYAVEHLGSRLVVVLGHERCGAVKAALDGGEAHGHVGSLVHAIAPAVEKVKDAEGDKLDLAVRANVSRVVEQLRGSEPLLKEAVGKGDLKIVGMRYDLDTGKVEEVQ
ncbi:MAG TPA: carbonic anhydrase [Thermoanaerobaculia bacterium]|jgi:carbonic anhydrase|nr:carbonic anhydrase [Thermoanaerobaculia bacterium]